MRSIKFILAGLMLALVLSVGPVQAQTIRNKNWANKVENSYLRNFHEVNDQLYRSAQPNLGGFELVSGLGIKSVLNLRSSHSDRGYLKGFSLRYYHVPMHADDFGDREIILALQTLLAAPKPVLVHCRRGSDRTGVVIAMYRIVVQGWAKSEALAEMQEGGFDFDQDLHNIPAYIRRADVEGIRKVLGLED